MLLLLFFLFFASASNSDSNGNKSLRPSLIFRSPTDKPKSFGFIYSGPDADATDADADADATDADATAADADADADAEPVHFLIETVSKTLSKIGAASLVRTATVRMKRAHKKMSLKMAQDVE